MQEKKKSNISCGQHYSQSLHTWRNEYFFSRKVTICLEGASWYANGSEDRCLPHRMNKVHVGPFQPWKTFVAQQRWNLNVIEYAFLTVLYGCSLGGKTHSKIPPVRH